MQLTLVSAMCGRSWRRRKIFSPLQGGNRLFACFRNVWLSSHMLSPGGPCCSLTRSTDSIKLSRFENLEPQLGVQLLTT